MPPTATSLIVPPGFLDADTEYEWEVLAIEAGGNQTLSSSFFTTMPLCRASPAPATVCHRGRADAFGIVS
jgi:hypothetical protein